MTGWILYNTPRSTLPEHTVTSHIAPQIGGNHGSIPLWSLGLSSLAPLGSGQGDARYTYSSWRKSAHVQATGGVHSTACPTLRGCWIHCVHSQGGGLWVSPTLEASPQPPHIQCVWFIINKYGIFFSFVLLTITKWHIAYIFHDPVTEYIHMVNLNARIRVGWKTIPNIKISNLNFKLKFQTQTWTSKN